MTIQSNIRLPCTFPKHVPFIFFYIDFGPQSFSKCKFQWEHVNLCLFLHIIPTPSNNTFHKTKTRLEDCNNFATFWSVSRMSTRLKNLYFLRPPICMTMWPYLLLGQTLNDELNTLWFSHWTYYILKAWPFLPKRLPQSFMSSSWPHLAWRFFKCFKNI